jgi:Tfp pilus assembly protein PilX
MKAGVNGARPVPFTNAGERGLALVVALIVLVAMSLSAAALIRAVDTTIAVTGNLALREASIPPADAAVEEAFASLFQANVITDREHDLVARSYYASRQPGEDGRGVPFALQLPGNYPANARVLDAGSGNSLRYVIERVCLHPGPATPGNCALVRPYASGGTPTPDASASAPPVPLFRVTIRVDGPQNAVSHVQSMLRDSSPPRRMSWRILSE